MTDIFSSKQSFAIRGSMMMVLLVSRNWRRPMPVFARYLNTRESTVQKWEAGTKRPSGMALKLLAVVVWS